MSFILLQMLLYLLIASLIGVAIGWYLRGDCSKKIFEIKSDCEMKMRAIEREWNTKLNYSDEKDINSQIDSQTPADLKTKTENYINLVAAKEILAQKKVLLSDDKIKVYIDNDIDFETFEYLEDNYDIQMIDGINAKYAQRFNDIGIYQTQDLIKLNKNYKDINFVAKKLKVQPEDILSWISIANIMQLPKINAHIAKLIEDTGIFSLRDLSVVNTNSLYKKMVELNENTHIVDKVPDIESLKLWSKIAKQL